jgi:hypothetical protein
VDLTLLLFTIVMAMPEHQPLLYLIYCAGRQLLIFNHFPYTKCYSIYLNLQNTCYKCEVPHGFRHKIIIALVSFHFSFYFEAENKQLFQGVPEVVILGCFLGMWVRSS